MSFRSFARNRIARMGFLISEVSEPCQIGSVLQLLQPVITDYSLIRVGGAADGGYLVPDDLSEIIACFSPGVDVVATFESDLIDRGIRCYLADASVKHSPLVHPLIDFDPVFVGSRDDVNTITLETWIHQKLESNEGDLILQMDIEGAEWSTLLSTPSYVLRRFRIIVLELHHVSRIFDPFGLDIIRSTISSLLDQFHVVHIHPNNNVGIVSNGGNSVSDVIELTLLRKDRSPALGAVKDLPHRLDVDCIPNKPHVAKAFTTID